MYVEDEKSATPNLMGVERYRLPQDLTHMCKFESEHSPGFNVVAETIQRYSEEAPSVISRRWLDAKIPQFPVTTRGSDFFEQRGNVGA